MIQSGFSRFLAIALMAVAGFAMMAVSFEAEARRMSGGGSMGRQSSNVMQQRQAVTPPSTPTSRAGRESAGASTSAAAGAAATSGASRWLGPIAGIAAGLGIAAMLSHFGLSGAFAEFLSSALLIALVVFAVMFVVRRFLRGGALGALVAAKQNAMARAGEASNGATSQPPLWREALSPAAPSAASNAATTMMSSAATPQLNEQNNWFIPGDFDTPAFLTQAKQQFVRIQEIWDSGNTTLLREFLTDDLITELKPQLTERGDAGNKTEVVLLNADLLGIEKVSDGYLASVRFSGMLREAPGAEAFRFEEVWNLFKSENGGWLLAGIQQIPVEHAR